MKRKYKAGLAGKILPVLVKETEKCGLCARRCGVNRAVGEKGACGAGKDPVVYTSMVHHGEEPPISGQKGSGAIFFSFCAMKCVYCQNYRFSQGGIGREVTPEKLAEIMIRLQDEGCHNINLVNPTHFAPGIVEAIGLASSSGLEIPVVYNTGGYDTVDLIRALEGLVDIYLPDMRYSSDEMAIKYSFSPGYVDLNRLCVIEMKRQAGRLVTADGGIAVSGVIVRLLILPEDISGTGSTLRFVVSGLGTDTSISIMSQYYPAYSASCHEGLKRRISRDEYDRVVAEMRSLGLENGWVQPFSRELDEKFAGENFLPDA